MIQSSVSFITVLTFPLTPIIVVIILFTIIKALKMYSLSTHLKELLRTWDVLNKPEIFSPQKRENKIIISQKRVQYNIAQTLYLWEKFSLYTLTKSVKIPSISNKLGTDFTVVRVPQIDPSVALFPV